MKVFISWSGNRSHYLAESLKNWLPKVLQAVKPWMSDEDIATGTRWFSEISIQLETAKAGIICLTPENQHNPWLMFETGSLSKTIANTYVCPFLYDLGPSQLSGPLTQFQAASSNKDGTLKIIQTLNKALDGAQLPENDVEEIFDVWWPKLDERLSAMPQVEGPKGKERTIKEIAEELLNNTREQLRREDLRLISSTERDEKIDQFIAMMDKMFASFGKSSDLFNQIEAEVLRALPSDSSSSAISAAMSHADFGAMQKLVHDLKEFSVNQSAITKKLLERPGEGGNDSTIEDNPSKAQSAEE